MFASGGDVLDEGVRDEAALFTALCRRGEGPRQWEPLCDLADEAKYWLMSADQLYRYPKNVISLADELEAAIMALGPRCVELVAPSTQTLCRNSVASPLRAVPVGVQS